MLRPERMSRVSVTGSKAVMDEVVETVHELHVLHVTEYGGGWDGFTPGDPVEGADEASDRLVTVRSLQSILGVDEEDAGSSRIDVDGDIEAELESVREEVNALDDRRDELESELREVEEERSQVDPFAELGIDLDLLSGYESLSVAVGEGDADDVRETLRTTEGVEAFEVYSEGRTVAAFVYPAEAPVDDALVSADFAAVEVPDVEASTEGVSPERYAGQLEERRAELESQLDDVEDELAALREEVGGFLLAAEETLAIEVQKREAPLSFATTENAFVAEGWLPTERFVDLAEGLQQSVGDHVEIDVLEERDYDAEGYAREPTGTPGHDEAPAADGGREPADERPVADGGAAASGTAGADIPMSDEEPPVVQDNPGPVEPFEMLTEVINRPKYSELDPTVILFLTFPVFFGFMIGDLGYGVLYMAIGWWLYANADSSGLRSLGAIALWAGGFTALFGILYGEIFGLHLVGEYLWHGHPPLHKGLAPGEVHYAQLWLVVSLLVGIAHVLLGYVLGFVEELEHHGLKAAVLEKGSWIVLMVGVWTWIFSHSFAGSKPEFLFHVFAGEPFALGFEGFSAGVGVGGLVLAGVGFVLLLAGEGGIGAMESLNVLVNILSYARIAAVLLAKAGMAFVVNLLFFGAYQHEGEFHYLLGKGPGKVEHGHVMFDGLVHMGPAMVLLGLVVLVVGHALVLALGITSAGLQAIRLEYVEFFQKFYEGGGEAYRPFGRVRQFTAED